MRVAHTLAAHVRQAEQSGRRVRAFGAGTSLSEHGADELPVDTRGFDRVLPLWEGVRTAAHPEGLVQVECGVRVHALQRWLRARGRMLENTAAFTGQTVVGALATASHGTGLGIPPMCDQVVSVVLVTRGGRVVRVEPAVGPTHPDLHDEPGIELLQDEALFHAVLTGLGAFGLVAAVTLRTLPAVPLWERRELHTLDQALDGPLADPGHVRHASMLFSPMPHDGARAAAVTLRDAADPLHALDRVRPRQRLVPTLFGRLPLDVPVRAWMRWRPSSAPGILDTALRSTVRRPLRGAAHRILDNWPLNRSAPARAAEVFVPLAGWRSAVHALVRVAEEEARHGRYLTAPISVRFVGASRHLLAPTYREAGAMIEVVHLRGTADEDRALLPYVDALRSYSGRMHLGLETPGLSIERDYTELVRFQGLLCALDPGPAFGLPRFLEAPWGL